MVSYHYMISNNKIAQIFDKIRTAAQPPKFTSEFLKNIGFTSSNDRAFINILKNLEFLNGEGIPTSYYSDLKDITRSKQAIATQIKKYYKELFSIDTNMNTANDNEIKGAISRVTGKEENDVKRMLATFKSLCRYADFSQIEASYVEEDNIEQIEDRQTKNSNSSQEPLYVSPDFHYNIQIHLPATTDISVYNAIFKSLKDNLFK